MDRPSGFQTSIPKSNASHEAACPRCGAVGRPVTDRTIEAILAPGFAPSLLAVERRFCKTPDCAVLYYGEGGRAVEKDAACVRVGVKESEDPVALCYCFGFTRADVRAEVAATGATTIPTRITAEIRAGRCRCEVANPSGTCCLGEVNRAVEEAMKLVGISRASGKSR